MRAFQLPTFSPQSHLCISNTRAYTRDSRQRTTHKGLAQRGDSATAAPDAVTGHCATRGHTVQYCA